LIYAIFSRSDRQPGRKRADDRIAQAVDYLRKNLHEDMAVPGLAWRFTLSTTHFRNLFKAYTDRSPKEFMVFLRITKAQELLSGGMRIKEVAERVGFKDEFYFMRMFKKLTGTPPGKFVKA
jgi:transcriptional regulator GlxA family with amidase domain